MTKECRLTRGRTTRQAVFSDKQLEDICNYLTRRICLPHDSPYLTEEVFDAALVSAHLSRAEEVSVSMLWLRARREAVRELYRWIGHRQTGDGKPKKSGFKLPTLFTEAMSLDYEGVAVDNPKLPPQENLYDAVDNCDFVQHLLSRLDGKQRGLLVARYFDGKSDAEIARQENVKQGHGIARRVDAALRMLRRLPEWQNYVDEAGLGRLPGCG